MPTPYSPSSGREKPRTSLFRNRNALKEYEFVWNLDQDAGAVAAVGVGPFGTAVTEVFQDGQGIVDDAVGLLPFYIGNDTDATGIVFI